MDDPVNIGYWRIYDGLEVDLVLERYDGTVGGLRLPCFGSSLPDRRRRADRRRAPRLRSEQGQWHHGDAVLATIGVRAGGQAHPVSQTITDLFLKPVEMPDILASDCRREFYFDSHYATVFALYYEINFTSVFAIVCT